MYCQWQGKLVSVNDTVSLHTLKEVQKEWKLTPIGSIPLSHANITCHSLRVLFDSSQGCHKPFLLVNHSRTNTHELFECDFMNNQIVSRHKFDCLKKKSSFKLDLFHGPTLLQSDGSVLTISTCSSEFLATNTIDMSRLCNKDVNIDKYWAFDWSTRASNDECILLMAQLSSYNEKKSPMSSNSSTDTTHWVSLIIENRESGIRISQSLEHVPYEYGCIATCIDCCSSVSVNSASGDFVKPNWFVVGTSFKQVAVFEGGALLHCVSLDNVPQKIAVKESTGEYLTFAVLCGRGKCSAFKISENGQQQCESWQDTSDVLVGDFAGIGHKQFLILHDNGKLKFSVTDLSLFSTEESKMDIDEGQESTGSLSDTVKAFQLKKRSGENELTELETELQRKSEAIQSSLTYMSSLGHHSGSAPVSLYNSDMLCIVPGKVSPEQQSILKREQSVSSDQQISGSSILKVKHTWQRFDGGQWVVGLVVENVSKRKLKDVRFSLVVPDALIPTKCSSKVVWAESKTITDNSFLSPHEPPAKRKKLHEFVIGEDDKTLTINDLDKLESDLSACAIVSMSLPNWTGKRKIDATVVVSMKMSTDESTGTEAAVVDIPVSISLDEICSNKVKVQESCLGLWRGEEFLSVREVNWDEQEYQDLATLLGAHTISKITATTKLTSWDHFYSILKLRLPITGPYTLQLVQHSNRSSTATCTSIHCNGNDASRHDLTSKTQRSSEIMEGIAVCISPSSKSTAQISIMYRLECQLSLVLAVLQRSLPPDMTLAES